MKKIVSAVLLLAAVFAASSCNQAKPLGSIIGTWETSQWEGDMDNYISVNSTYVFYEDGTGVLDFGFSKSLEDESDYYYTYYGEGSAKFDWKIEDDVLTETITDVTFSDFNGTVMIPDFDTDYIDEGILEMEKEEFINAMKEKPYVETLLAVTKNTMVSEEADDSGEVETIVYTRKK